MIRPALVIAFAAVLVPACGSALFPKHRSSAPPSEPVSAEMKTVETDHWRLSYSAPPGATVETERLETDRGDGFTFLPAMRLPVTSGSVQDVQLEVDEQPCAQTAARLKKAGTPRDDGQGLASVDAFETGVAGTVVFRRTLQVSRQGDCALLTFTSPVTTPPPYALSAPARTLLGLIEGSIQHR